MDMKDGMTAGEYSVKAVKSFLGREGYGFNCNLYRKGKKVAFCYDDASGGPISIDWLGAPPCGATDTQWDEWRAFRNEEEKLLNTHVATFPKVKSNFSDNELTIDPEWFVTELVNEYEHQKEVRKLKKACTTKTLYKTKDCKPSGYYIWKRPFSEEVAVSIRKSEGEDVEIFNEVFAKGEIPSVLLPPPVKELS
jgi:hypothetical protein